jgi:hypothetical protein
MEANLEKAVYAHVIIKLLQGPIYSDEKVWKDLQVWNSPIQDYFNRIGIKLITNEVDGFARVIQPEADEYDENPLPRLMRKQAMNYETTLLCVILREYLEEQDILNEGRKLFLTQKEIKERIELFYKEQANKSKLWRDLSKPINNLTGMGILKITREDSTNKDNNQYEVKRIIKALVNNEKLEEIKTKLQKYVNAVQQ